MPNVKLDFINLKRSSVPAFHSGDTEIELTLEWALLVAQTLHYIADNDAPSIRDYSWNLVVSTKDFEGILAFGEKKLPRGGVSNKCLFFNVNSEANAEPRLLAICEYCESAFEPVDGHASNTCCTDCAYQNSLDEVS